MAPPRIRKYPKSILVNDQAYQIKFVRRFKDKDQVGECDPGEHVISIKQGLGLTETFFTLIHELIHAIEFEYDLKINHKMVYKLETSISRLILGNF